MVDTSAEAVAKTWEEYCNSARSRGTHEDGETETYDIDDMNDAAHDLHLLNEAIAAERDALRAQLDAADAAWCERVSLLEKALDAKQAHDAKKLNNMVDNAIENLARAWASMDGKPFDDNRYREGYIADAAELLDRSGIASERAAARAQQDAARAAPKLKPLVWEYHPCGAIAAPPTGHSYIIDTRMKGRVYSVKGFNPQRDFESLDEAKAAAQADFERRILDALE